ncbi:MAG: hypothetical protein PUC29_02530, partial [Clostridia bacterium]|nr:hypothetical protein [Clostridia bacterium]
ENKSSFFRSYEISEPENLLYCLNNSLFINNLVRINTEAENKVQEPFYSNYVKYNYVFTNLKNNLIKEANGK